MSVTFDCSDPDARSNGLAAAARAVRAGGLVVLPTDTVYGLGCDAFSATSDQSSSPGLGFCFARMSD